MTVIMGVLDKKNKCVHMMGDSLVSRGELKALHINKIYKDNEFIIGGAGYLSILQLFKRSINFPSEKQIEENGIEINIDFMVNHLKPTINKIMKANSIEGFGEILIAYKDKLFTINTINSGHVFNIQDCTSTGTGMDFALSTYNNLNHIDNIEERLFKSIKSATDNIRSCELPAYYINTKEMEFKEFNQEGQWKYVEQDEQW